MADNGSSRLPRYPFTRSSSAPADAASRDHQQANDPLSELARLIGQQDPFADPVPPAVRRDLREILAGKREPEAPHTPSWSNSEWRDSDFAERRDSLRPGRRDSDWATAPQLPETDYDSYDPHSTAQRYDPPLDAGNLQNGHASYENVQNSQTAGYESDMSDPSVFELPRLDETQSQPPYETSSEYGQGRADVPLYGDNGQLLHAELPEEEAYPPGYAGVPYQPEEAPPRSRKSLAAVIAVFCLAVAGTAGAYAYRMMFSGGVGGPPPLIRADTTPNKVAVAQTAEGAGKQIYDRFGGDKSQNEKLVQREEQPVDVRSVQSQPSFQPPAASTQGGWPSSAGTTSTPAPTGGANAATEPRRIKTIPIRSDQLASAPATTESSPPQEALPSPAAPPPTQPAHAEPKPAPAPRHATAPTSSNGPLSLTPQGTSRGSSRTASAATAAASGAYVVQLAAHKTQEEASAAFRSAQSRYPSILGSQRMLIRRKEVPGHGTFYGAQVGPFASRSEAVQLCVSLKSAGGDCIVQRN